jgi:hypothetical protein
LRRIGLVFTVAVALILGSLGVASAQDSTTPTDTTTQDNTTAADSTGQNSSANKLVLKKIKPQNGATGVSRDTTVKATFNEDLDKSTVRNNFSLKDTDTGNLVDATITVNGNVATLTPKQGLKRGDHYKAILDSGLRSKSGDRLQSVDSSGANFDRSNHRASWTFRVQT